MAGSDFSRPCITGYGSSPSRCGPARQAPVGREISRFPRKERPCMPGSLTTPGRRALALTRPLVWPSVTVTTSAPGTVALSRLDGRPARSPADASPDPSRGPTHGSGPVWLARPPLQRTPTSYSLPVSRRTTVGEVGWAAADGYAAADPPHRRPAMLKPGPIGPVPEATARVARAAFRKGNPLLKLRDELGGIFADADFADLFPKLGQPGLPPWRLALVTLLQFRENLPDRQAAEAVRARIDWKYLLGLELDDPGFDHSVLCEFRARLLEGGAEERLLGKLLEACQARGLLEARGRQRTDSTRVLASIRVLNSLELLGETLRAALNELAAAAPDWLRGAAPRAWHERYGRRVEDDRLPRSAAEREAYARTVGEDGFALLDLLERPGTPEGLGGLPKVGVLRQVWARHFDRGAPEGPGDGVRLKPKEELPPAADKPESPYDPEARFRHRGRVSWVGYVVHTIRTQ